MRIGSPPADRAMAGSPSRTSSSPGERAFTRNLLALHPAPREVKRAPGRPSRQKRGLSPFLAPGLPPQPARALDDGQEPVGRGELRQLLARRPFELRAI